jgi:hypothetical protein
MHTHTHIKNKEIYSLLSAISKKGIVRYVIYKCIQEKYPYSFIKNK